MELKVKRLEEANHLLQFELRALFDAMPMLAWSAQADGARDFYNRGWYEYTGTTFEEMQGWGWQRVHDPEMLPSMMARWQASVRTGAPFEMEFPLRRHDGRFRWFLTRVNPIRDASGNVARWVGVNTDVDDQRRAQAQAQYDLDTFFEMSIDLLCIAGLDGFFKRLNPAWTETLGFSAEELKAKPWLSFVHPDDVEATVGATLARTERTAGSSGARLPPRSSGSSTPPRATSPHESRPTRTAPDCRSV
jgi:PAS domain S-box-containing protein